MDFRNTEIRKYLPIKLSTRSDTLRISYASGKMVGGHSVKVDMYLGHTKKVFSNGFQPDLHSRGYKFSLNKLPKKKKTTVLLCRHYFLISATLDGENLGPSNVPLLMHVSSELHEQLNNLRRQT